MPELPEVETIKNTLIPILKNKKIIKIDVLREKTLLTNKDLFTSSLINASFTDIKRRGKFLIFILDNGFVFLSHLRMEGKYYLLSEKEENSKYSRIVFHLNTNEKLIFDDSRCFGIIKLSNISNLKNEEEIKKIGKEPSEIDEDYIFEIINKVKNKDLEIKSTLLDQSLIAGLGNIYADETLYKSFINPKDKAKDINKKQWEEIIKSADEILKNAIKLGGSTIKSYHPGKDVDGNFQTKLLCYGKKDEECPRCHHHFRFLKINGRGTTYCPYCQKKKSTPFIVGIYGKISSGKSTALNILKKDNYKVFSADECVKQLYKNRKVIEKINEIAHSNFKVEVDKKEIKEKIIKDKTILKKINNYIHPLVKKEAELFIKKNKKENIIFLEIPLLFESHMEGLFDYIIGIDINKNIQLERLIKRNGNDALSLLKINENNNFDKNKTKMDFIINNDEDLENFKINLEKIINKLKDYQN